MEMELDFDQSQVSFPQERRGSAELHYIYWPDNRNGPLLDWHTDQETVGALTRFNRRHGHHSSSPDARTDS